ncbi:ankyrin repeat domain-containing protein 55 [Elysia marginata]|uniref:Ankyrin repeat domain-containing protein 55 n=1 Tax=Elysia marginata TaxID=1093978 RepID=A0AAV4H619_9GAST|nr:ankyrin repeat domain-containing protein 55 [Elysia marginata]
MVIKRKDFQKAAAFIHEFLLKLSEDVECAEVRDTLNLALLHMQKYYRLIQNRSQEKCANTLSLTQRGLSPMTPFVDAPDKFIWRWLNLDNAKLPSSMGLGDSLSIVVLPPIITAAKAGDVELASELIHQDGSTAMHRACHDGNHLALQLLVDYGGDFTLSDVQGRAPIHWAVTTRSTECLQVLLNNRVFAGTRDKDGLTPSMWACRMDNIRHFELLCQAENNHVEEPDGIERDGNGRTWMHWSVRRTQPLECLQTLLTPDSASIKDDEGKTVLLVAAEMGSLPACRLIVEIAGSRCIMDQDSQGRSALHLATMGGHGDVVNFLLEKHADVNVVDSFKATAWDYARIRKLHYCQLIIMSHQRQRMSSNPNSPLPNGFGLLMREDSAGMHDDFSRMSFRTRSNQSTPITPPHPPKRPRSSRMLARRSNSLTSADRERAREQEREWSRMHQSEDRSASSGGKKERLSVMVNTSNKRMSAGDIYMNGREDTMMTESSRPVFEDENDEISVGGMDVSDIEDEGDHGSMHGGPSRGPSEQAHPTPRPRPPPRGRPPHFMGAPSPPAYPPQSGINMQGFFNNVNNMNMSRVNNLNNNNNNINQQQQEPQHSQQQQQQQQKQQQHRPKLQVPQHMMEYEDTGSGPSPRHIAHLNMNSNSQRRQDQQQQQQPQQQRPQARVPPTPVYRPQRGTVPGGSGMMAPTSPTVPSPPSSTPQRPHMLRQQQVLPAPPAVSPPTAAPRELTPPTVRDPSPPSQGSEQQHSSRSQGEHPSSGGNQPPGLSS